MQISLNWINELINIETIDLEELINKLTLGGFEVEEILEVEIKNKKIITLDISATANRSDSLSISGLALELGILLNELPKLSNYRKKNETWSEKLKINAQPILLNIPCSDFIGLTIENFHNPESPKWLQQKLYASGINPENSLVDFQNYLLLETGYPFEFYDLNKIYTQLNDTNFNLHLTYENKFENFVANNGTTYELDNSILTLKANNLSIGLAGLITSKDVCYSNQTTSLLIEGSIFNAAKIRQQSKRLNLRTDRSSRYEKSIKNTNLLESFYRLISLLRIANPNLICKFHTIAQAPEIELPTILLKYQTIKQILGPIETGETKEYEYISPQIVSELLNRLQFTFEYDEKKMEWKIRVPSFRSDDIEQEIDVVEEIGRLYGFNNFLTRLPNIHRIGKEDFNYQTRKKLTSCLTNLGFTELIQYSLVKPTQDFENAISLINPLAQDYSSLRTSLLPSLVKAAEENIKKGNIKLEGFEYGHIFSNKETQMFQEKEMLAGIFGGTECKSTWSESSKSLSWFEAKGKIERLFKSLNLPVYWTLAKTLKQTDLLHSYRTATLYLLNGQKLGVFGQLNPTIAKKLNLTSDLYLFEFDFELIQNQIQQTKLALYHEYSLYPKIIKDLSFIIHTTICFEEIKNILYLNGSKFLTNIALLDEYQGTSVPKKHRSLCLQLTFQSDKGTLQNKKVETVINSLKRILTTKFNATVRS